MDPLDLRDKIDENAARRVERSIIREKTDWKNRNSLKWQSDKSII